jgi:hypothetical protein
MKKILGSFIILLSLLACRHQKNKIETPKDNGKPGNKTIIKPPSIFSDTLKIESKAAVFYYPDSLQLMKIKAGMDTAVYYAIMHEYFSQARYAHIEINKNWPGIKIIDAKHVRYLLFIKAGNNKEIIDLDTKYDPYGLFLFHPSKEPILADMMNINTELNFYFVK